MLNKKIVAVAVAAAFTSGTAYSVDLDTATDEVLTYALQAVSPAAITAGEVEVDDSGSAGALDVSVDLGFTIGDGTSKYMRLDLTNAEFGTGGVVLPVIANGSLTISAGGNAGDTYVIVELAATGADLAPSTSIVFDTGAYVIMTDGSIAAAQYRLYETAVAAANPTAPSSLTLKSVSKQFAEVASVSTGDFTDASNEVATVATDFEQFTASTLGGSTTHGSVGSIDATDLIGAGGAFDLDSSAITAADLLVDGPYTLTLVGDLSFGTWTLETGATDCDSGAATATFNSTTGVLGTTLTAAAIAADTHLICVEVDGSTTINKGGYSVELLGASMGAVAATNTIGNINYDTTSIEIPYLTTFSDYNQRLYIVNSGPNAAEYSITFVAEAGVTATPGTAATGSVPAGEMIAIRATDIVTLTGRTRTSAVLEVEGIDANIQAATQTVNLSDKSTDTVILNANSIVVAPQP